MEKKNSKGWLSIQATILLKINDGSTFNEKHPRLVGFTDSDDVKLKMKRESGLKQFVGGATFFCREWQKLLEFQSSSRKAAEWRLRRQCGRFIRCCVLLFNHMKEVYDQQDVKRCLCYSLSRVAACQHFFLNEENDETFKNLRNSE